RACLNCLHISDDRPSLRRRQRPCVVRHPAAAAGYELEELTRQQRTSGVSQERWRRGRHISADAAIPSSRRAMTRRAIDAELLRANREQLGHDGDRRRGDENAVPFAGGCGFTERELLARERPGWRR